MPDNVLAQIQPCFPAWGGNWDWVVHRKPGMVPGKYWTCKVRVEQPPINEQLYYSPPENLDKLCGIFNRDVVERARLVDTSFQNETVVVRVPSHQVAEGLVWDNNPCFYCCCCWFCIVLVYDGKYDLWNFFEEVPVIFEIHPKQFREGEYKLAVR